MKMNETHCLPAAAVQAVRKNPPAIRFALDPALVDQPRIVVRPVSAMKIPGIFVSIRAGADNLRLPRHAKCSPDFRLLAASEHYRIVRARRAGIFTETVASVTVNSRVDHEWFALKPELVTQQIAMCVCTVVAG